MTRKKEISILPFNHVHLPVSRKKVLIYFYDNLEYSLFYSKVPNQRLAQNIWYFTSYPIFLIFDSEPWKYFLSTLAFRATYNWISKHVYIARYQRNYMNTVNLCQCRRFNLISMVLLNVFRISQVLCKVYFLSLVQ